MPAAPCAGAVLRCRQPHPACLGRSWTRALSGWRCWRPHSACFAAGGHTPRPSLPAAAGTPCQVRAWTVEVLRMHGPLTRWAPGWARVHCPLDRAAAALAWRVLALLCTTGLRAVPRVRSQSDHEACRERLIMIRRVRLACGGEPSHTRQARARSVDRTLAACACSVASPAIVHLPARAPPACSAPCAHDELARPRWQLHGELAHSARCRPRCWFTLLRRSVLRTRGLLCRCPELCLRGFLCRRGVHRRSVSLHISMPFRRAPATAARPHRCYRRPLPTDCLYAACATRAGPRASGRARFRAIVR